MFSDEQNVSCDMLGENAAVVIEGVETHTRTGFIDLVVPECEPVQEGVAVAGGGPAAGRPAAGDDPVPHRTVRVPLTHVKIFGWYDNEMGSYT